MDGRLRAADKIMISAKSKKHDIRTRPGHFKNPGVSGHSNFPCYPGNTGDSKKNWGYEGFPEDSKKNMIVEQKRDI